MTARRRPAAAAVAALALASVGSIAPSAVEAQGGRGAGAPRATTAATTPARMESLVQARIHSEAVHGREPFLVGVEFRMAPGWHIYWKNPGDAGLAPRLRWRLPPGYTASEPSFPAPRKIVKEGFVDYGLARSATLLVTITPPRDGRAVDQPVLGLDADWLVCKEECRPGRASLAFTPGPRSEVEARSMRQAMAEARRQIPRAPEPGELRVREATFERGPGGAAIHVRLDGERASEVRDFYPEVLEGWDMDLAAITASGGTIRIPLRTSSAPQPRRLKGLVVLSSGTYNLTCDIR